MRVTAPAALLVTVPAPASEPIVSLKPREVEGGRRGDGHRARGPDARWSAPRASVPALTVVAPV